MPALAEYGSGFAVIQNRLYSYGNGRISARAIESGNVLWDVPVQAPGGSIDVAPIVEDGALVFCAGGSAQRILALDASTGKLLWNKDGDCRAVASAGGRIFVLHRPDGSISSLDGRSGKRLWENAGNGPATTIVVLKDRVVSNMIQLDENSGKTIRKSHLSKVLLGAANDALFWEGSSGELICSNVSERELWSLPMPLRHIVQFQSDASGEFIAVYDDYPFVGKSGVLLKIDAQGHKLWETPVSTGLPLPASPFTQFNEELLVLLPVDSQHSIVRAFSKITGTEMWASQPLEGAVGPAVDARGAILFRTRSGQIDVLSRSTGSATRY